MAPAGTRLKFVLAIAFLATLGGILALSSSARDWVSTSVSLLARGDVQQLKAWLLSYGAWAPAASALLMILQSVAAPLPAFVITFANGLLFGTWWGALLSWSSAMAGASLCFFLARALGRPAAEKLAGGSRALALSDRFFERHGDRAVVVARLLPFVPFDVISYGAGLTPMPFWRFLVATGVGQLPATLVYSWLGQNMSGSVRAVFWSFLGFLAIAVAVSMLKPRPPAAPADAEPPYVEPGGPA